MIHLYALFLFRSVLKVISFIASFVLCSVKSPGRDVVIRYQVSASSTTSVQEGGGPALVFSMFAFRMIFTVKIVRMPFSLLRARAL